MSDDPPRAVTPAPDSSDTTVLGTSGTCLVDDASAATVVPGGPGRAAQLMLPPPGYKLGPQIGRGGMGEVVVAEDLRIGREVAVKRMTTKEPDGEQLARFLREARIQARLDHPAIVPVHELGIDEEGRPFFAMKRLTGKTLGQRLAEPEPQPLNRLLRAFVDVCLAIEFAHAKGVVHRDLKPSNVMMGEYGEVYVIDWGIARVLAEDEESSSSPVRQFDIGTLDQGTKTGALLGTPGYMAPEQIRGQKATTPADVYALGAILFELLVGGPLHKRGESGIASTLSNPQVSPAARKPEANIPPELDALCWAALSEDPTRRPTAHELAERVQAFLDGDRDLVRRRELAAEQLASARAVLESTAPDARAAAMRRAGRALALDPQSVDAGELVSTLLLEPPPKLPPDLERGLAEQETNLNKDRSRKGILMYLSVFLLLPFTLFQDIKNWPFVVAFYAVLGLAALVSVRFAKTGRPLVTVVLTINLTLSVMFSRIASPFVLTPLMTCAALAAITAIPWVNRRTWVMVVWATLATSLPIAAEWLDLIPRTWTIGQGSMVIVSDVVRSHGTVTEIALVFSNLLFTIIIGLFVLMITRRRRMAQQQLYVQAWHLRQLLPSAKRPWATNAG